MRTSTTQPPRIALALAGGGPLGAIYEIGALCAFDEALAAFRSMIHSRMALGMKHYERAYPGTDILLIEPDPHDAQLFVANAVLHDAARHLVQPRTPPTRIGRAMASLNTCMDELEVALQAG